MQQLSVISLEHVSTFFCYFFIPTAGEMTFSLFLPSATKETTPVLFWLSGLTCDDTNFSIKAGPRAFASANRHGLAIVMPDTSPRGEAVPNVNSYDLGHGAGFYVSAVL